MADATKRAPPSPNGRDETRPSKIPEGHALRVLFASRWCLSGSWPNLLAAEPTVILVITHPHTRSRFLQRPTRSAVPSPFCLPPTGPQANSFLSQSPYRRILMYKSHVLTWEATSVRMPSKAAMLHEWHIPARLILHVEAQTWKRSKQVFPRVAAITSVITGLVFLFLSYVTPAELGIELGRMWLHCQCFVLVMTSLPIVAAFLSLGWPTERRTYHMIEDKVYSRRPGQAGWVLPWSRIQGYRLLPFPDLDGITGLSLTCRRGTRRLVLPEGPQAREILQTISQRIPLLTPPEPDPIVRLPPRRVVWLWVLSGLYVAGAWAGLAFLQPRIDVIGVCATFILFTPGLGPGTWPMTFWYGLRFRKNHSLVEYALLANISSAFLFCCGAVLRTYWILCEIARGSIRW